MWIVCGFFSLGFCIFSWLMSFNKNSNAIWASLCSLAFTALTLLMQYRLVVNWVSKQDWSALLDVVPGMYSVLTGYVIFMLFANAFSVARVTRKNSNCEQGDGYAIRFKKITVDKISF